MTGPEIARYTSENQIIRLLAKEVARAGSTRAAAKALRVPKSRISEFVNKKRRPNKRIIAALGFSPMPFYRRVHR